MSKLTDDQRFFIRCQSISLSLVMDGSGLSKADRTRIMDELIKSFIMQEVHALRRDIPFDLKRDIVSSATHQKLPFSCEARNQVISTLHILTANNAQKLALHL